MRPQHYQCVRKQSPDLPECLNIPSELGLCLTAVDSDLPPFYRGCVSRSCRIRPRPTLAPWTTRATTPKPSTRSLSLRPGSGVSVIGTAAQRLDHQPALRLGALRVLRCGGMLWVPDPGLGRRNLAQPDPAPTLWPCPVACASKRPTWPRGLLRQCRPSRTGHLLADGEPRGLT